MSKKSTVVRDRLGSRAWLVLGLLLSLNTSAKGVRVGLNFERLREISQEFDNNPFSAELKLNREILLDSCNIQTLFDPHHPNDWPKNQPGDLVHYSGADLLIGCQQLLNAAKNIPPTLQREFFQKFLASVQAKYPLQYAGRDFIYDTHEYIPPDYSVNFLWINKSKNLDQKYIFPDPGTMKAKLDELMDWKTSNNSAKFNLWYDSTLISDAALDNTKQYLTEHYPDLNVELKDVRIIEEVSRQENSVVFSDRINMWLRIDLLRELIPLHLARKGDDELADSSHYIVSSDFDISPIPEAELFSRKHLEILNSLGILLGDGGEESKGFGGYENSFHVISRKDKQVLQSMQLILVDKVIKWIKNEIARGKQSTKGSEIPQMVYSQYKNWLKYLYHLKNIGVLKAASSDKFGEPSYTDESGPTDLNNYAEAICRSGVTPAYEFLNHFLFEYYKNILPVLNHFPSGRDAHWIDSAGKLTPMYPKGPTIRIHTPSANMSYGDSVFQ